MRGKLAPISKLQGDLFGYTKKEWVTAIVNEIVDRIGPIKEAKQIKGKETIPEKGAEKYFVYNDRLGIYTSIGADNRHHASNKATKLFGPHWDSIRSNYQAKEGYQFYTVAQYGELIRSL